MRKIIEKVTCDKCGSEILPDQEITVLYPGKNPKNVGPNLIITPRGDRMYARSGEIMMRANTSFFIGVHPDDETQFDFHTECLRNEITSRLRRFLGGMNFNDTEELFDL